MLTVVPDTNALFGHDWMTTAAGWNLLELVRAGKCRVVLPQVVVDELNRQERKSLKSKRDKAKTALSDVSVDINASTIDEAFDRFGAKTAAARDRLLALSGVSVASVPEDRTRKLLDRDLAARRPFMETAGGNASYGFRDAVIWETVLDVLREDQTETADTLFFVSEDKGFIDDDVPKTLHRHLLEDLDARGIARDRVVLVEKLANVIDQVRAAAAEAEARAAEARAASTPPEDEAHELASLLRGYAFDASRRAELVRVATEALDELVGEPMDDVLIYGGDYGPPDWVQFDVPQIGGDLSIYGYGYDFESDFEFDAPDGDIVTGRADVILSIEAGDLFGESDEVRARLLVDIDIGNPAAFAVTDIVLEDTPNPPRPADPTSVTLDFDLDPEPTSIELDPEPTSIELDPEPTSIELDPEPTSAELDPEPASTELDPAPGGPGLDPDPS
ncbi:hypothetical protein QF011_002110 [Curtobacterium flaccumfaciens]|nr:PIN domain-containing protein [Curtobacterium flaccumfaciens]MDQ0539548.1 hypothetical protein [Curtobacterium flaccumfaciens]